jgi:uncharacterized protein (TIGR02231 family)
MKNVILPAVMFIAFSAHATNEKKIKSSIKNVTVFTQGAQVYRSSQVSLNPGVTDLVFSGISPFVNPTSIQAGGKGDFVVLEVKHNVKYSEPPKSTESALPIEILREIKLLEDSLIENGFKKDELTDKKNALQLEKDMIMKNKLANGEGKSDSLPVLKQAMEFFRQKLSDINSQLNKTKRDEKKNSDDNQRMTARMEDLKKYKNSEDPKTTYDPVHEIIVTVSADNATEGSVDINYMVSQAGWVPTYDLRSTTASAPVQITYKANVFQSTKEDWTGVKLKLSTSNPNRNNIKPILPPWYIDYYSGNLRNKDLYGAREAIPANSTLAIEELDEAKQSLNKMSPAQSAANYSQLVETMTNVMFDISLSYTIPSDGVNHIVSIKSEDLPATYYHYLVPKIESEAFLLAKVTGWENLNLLPGMANVFYEGTFVGETVLNPAIINDTLDLAFGRDNGITVTRTKKPVKENNKLLGSEITKTITYELKMKNNKSKTVNLVIEDQVPLSQNKEIKVEMKDAGNSDYNSQTGLLKWNLTVNSKEYKTLNFTYAVTYNKDMPLSMY